MIKTTTPCAVLVGEFRSIEMMLSSAIAGPIRLLNAVDGMVRNAALSALAVAQSEIDALANKVGLVMVEDTIAWMKTGLMILKGCSDAVTNNPLIQNAIDVDWSAIDDVVNPNQLPGFTRRYAEDKIRQNAYRMLDEGLSAIGLGGRIGLTQMRYLDMLRSAGILDGLRLMHDVITCMEMVCDHYTAYQIAYTGYLDALKIDSDYGISGDIFPSATPAKQAVINSSVNAAMSIQNQIDTWSIA